MKSFFKWVFIFLGVFFLISIFVGRWSESEEKLVPEDSNIGILEVNGVIMDSVPYLEQISEFKKQSHLKAIVIRINSPGGAVGSSQELFLELKKLREKYPVVVSMGDIAASGGLYTAIAGEKIFALPGTLTGSMGVLFQLTNVSKLLEKIYVQPVTIKSGRMKDAANPVQPLDPKAKELLEETVLRVFDQFKAAVQEERKLTPEAMATLADGRVVEGSLAVQLKLIDEIGTFEDAVEFARNEAKLKEAKLAYLSRKPKSWFEKALESSMTTLLQQFQQSAKVLWYRWEPN